MGRKNKLHKFAEVHAFPNVYECDNIKELLLPDGNKKAAGLKGHWNETHFKNNHPITLELACGGGEYTVGLAQMYPDRNFIGIDIKGNRIWAGAKEALDAGLDNAAFLRTRIEVLHAFFVPGEVSEIWITFADPFPRLGKENRRLTSANFLSIYRQILRPGGLIHIKHDDPDFYQFTLDSFAAAPDCEILYQNDDIYASPLAYAELALKTRYEEMHLANGRKIKYVIAKIAP
jgi:tRNA (guanine-N7-)-methyltransferase